MRMSSCERGDLKPRERRRTPREAGAVLSLGRVSVYGGMPTRGCPRFAMSSAWPRLTFGALAAAVECPGQRLGGFARLLAGEWAAILLSLFANATNGT